MWTNPSSETNSTYQGKEFQMGEWQNGDLGLYDFGARLYNPVLARWQCTDPMDQFDSPYNAMGNNPVINIDPDGMFSIPWGAIMSNIGNALSSFGRTTTRLIGMNDFVSGASVPVYASSTTRPFANLGSALNIAGTILSMGMDAKAILDAAGEMGERAVSNQDFIRPPQTQAEFDQRYFADFQNRMKSKIQNDFQNLSFQSTNANSWPTKKETISMLKSNLLNAEYFLSEIDPITGKVSLFQYRVVEFEIYEFDQYRTYPNDPTLEVPGTFESVVLVDELFRPDEPKFQIPTKNSSNNIRQRMIEFNNYPPPNYERTGYRISLTFQLVILN